MSSKNQIYASLACNLDQNLLQASLPLFESEKVAGLEWSFDTLYKTPRIPDWFVELLKTYGDEGRLVGHGVFFSIFKGNWSEEQQRWLDHLRKISSNFKFDHISEHFGFMTGEDFHKGAPMSVPFSKEVLEIGVDRLQRIYDACQCPVGLENLAFSYSLEDVQRHGEFLTRLIEPVNGFIILDLHNLYCQLSNFDLDFESLISCYPLDRVREIHISGGSWESSGVLPERTIRRDTHDDQVPEEVFELLRKVIPRCKNLKFVVLEQLGTALNSSSLQLNFQNDFLAMEKIVADYNTSVNIHFQNNFLQTHFEINSTPFQSLKLAQEQDELLKILQTATSTEVALQLLQKSSLANSDWNVESWSPYMLETAIRIAQKWEQGW